MNLKPGQLIGLRVRIVQGWDEERIMVKKPVVDAVQAVLTGECWVGIDVAKAHLDVATWPARERVQVTRDEAGLAQLVAWLQARPPNLIVLEATGGLETLVGGRWWKRTCRRP